MVPSCVRNKDEAGRMQQNRSYCDGATLIKNSRGSLLTKCGMMKTRCHKELL